VIFIAPVNGVIVPALTFFNDKSEINKELNTLLIRHIILNGANSVFLFNYIGEGLHFVNNISEKIKYIQLVSKISKNKLPILVGVYGNDSERILNEVNLLGEKFPNIDFVFTAPFSKKLEIADLKSFFESIFSSLHVKNQVYLLNNPTLFSGNYLEPNIVGWLLNYSNVVGIIDTSEKISTYKAYLGYLSEEFGVYCGNEERLATFLQLIPGEKIQFAGIVPAVGNLINICSKLYEAALHNEILDLVRLQEELNDFRNKLYDLRKEAGKQQRGLKYAFYTLYKEIIKSPLQDIFMVAPEFEKPLDEITLDRISATVNYLKNMNYILHYYPIGDHLFNIYDFNNLFLEIKEIVSLASINKIKGPYEGKKYIIYRFKSEESDIVLRVRVKNGEDNFIREKFLFPFLDKTFHKDLPDLHERIKKIATKKKGNYIFDNKKPPIIPVGDLLYFDETKELIPYPFTIQKYLKGKPLYYILDRYKKEEINLKTSKIQNLFFEIGKILAKLHQIQFNCFYKKITDIGKDLKIKWIEIIKEQIEKELQDAKKNKINIINEIENYFKQQDALIETDTEPVLIHCNYYDRNIIVEEKQAEFFITGLIDFDNWAIGARHVDFVKIENLTIDPLNEPELKKTFYKGYEQIYNNLINREFIEKIEFYKALWLLKKINYKKAHEKKLNQKKSVSLKFSNMDNLLNNLKKIIGLF